MNILILLAAINGATAVAAGAYGWHALGDTPEIRDIFMMGSQYQMWHALALLGTGVLVWFKPCRILAFAGGCFQIGIILFSGTLYSFGALSMIPVEGGAPLGGAILILGWLILGIQGSRRAIVS